MGSWAWPPLNQEPMQVLDTQCHKTELVFQWIKIAVVNSVSTGQLSAPPPILTRAFDEIDQCVAKFSQGEKLSRVPLPAQYAATLSLILIIHGCVTPAAMINFVGASYQAVMAAVLVTFMLWSVHRLAEILANPFDFWASDLNLKVLHNELNEKLRLGCGVRPKDVPVLPAPPHIAVTHNVPTASPTGQKLKIRSRTRRSGATRMSCTDELEKQEQRAKLKDIAPPHSSVSDTGAKEVHWLASGQSLTKEPPSKGVESPAEPDLEDQRDDPRVQGDSGSRVPRTSRKRFF